MMIDSDYLQIFEGALLTWLLRVIFVVIGPSVPQFMVFFVAQEL